MEHEAAAILLQYGALGAIAVLAISGTAWLVRGMRSDVHTMISAQAKAQKEFTDYLKERIREDAESRRQAYATNAAFVEAINNLTRRIDSYIDVAPLPKAGP